MSALKNECFQEHLGVANKGYIKIDSFKRIKYVQSRLATAPLKESFTMQVDGTPR